MPSADVGTPTGAPLSLRRIDQLIACSRPG
jgi:hypothetical protein